MVNEMKLFATLILSVGAILSVAASGENSFI